MAAITVRNIPEETHQALKALAMKHGRSTEAEVKLILEQAAWPEERFKLGTALAEFGQKYGGIDLEVAREKEPARVVNFS